MHYLDRYDSLFKFHATEHNLDWRLLKAQAIAESSMDENAMSHAGAMGLTQFMPATWEWAKEMGWIEKAADPFCPDTSIQAQACYMKWLLDRTDNDIIQALAAYNWGIGNVSKLEKTWDWMNLLPEETQGYIARIHKIMTKWENVNGGSKRDSV